MYHAVYTQNIDIGGGEVPLRGERAFNTTFVLRPESEAAGPVKTSVTLQDFAASFNMAHKHQVLETDHLRGKSLVLSVDPKGGQPRQLAALPPLNLGSTSGGKLDPAFLIEYSFPRLPQGAPLTGDTWEETVKGRRLAGNFQVDASVTTVHRYAGIEEVNHVPCVKIESSSTGRLEGSQKQMGEQWDYSGTLEGTATWYFEPNSGYLVRYTGTESARGTATVGGCFRPHHPGDPGRYRSRARCLGTRPWPSTRRPYEKRKPGP